MIYLPESVKIYHTIKEARGIFAKNPHIYKIMFYLGLDKHITKTNDKWVRGVFIYRDLTGNEFTYSRKMHMDLSYDWSAFDINGMVIARGRRD